MAGLAAVAVGAAGLLGTLDLRTLGPSWLVPAAVAIARLGVLATTLRPRRE
ncbi:MAG TPA: hypothetical protein VOB72_20105 [Candidatus Dormibacteraeota bacterium]|nr:hypothetical protein [Candidatus Dormibacteraeota bacterium]